jgi:hypothetical protein
MPELENQKEVILQFCKEILLFLGQQKATMRDFPNDYNLVTICYELLEFNNLITNEMQVFYLRFLGQSTKSINHYE